jgi:hypothetical protein
LNDLDFVAASFDSIPETIGSELLLRHVHPHDPPGKTMLQGVDPKTKHQRFRRDRGTLGREIFRGFYPVRRGSDVHPWAPYPYDQAAEATAINASGSVVGYSVTPGAGVGFVAHPDGCWAEVAILPANLECVSQTIPESINAAGTIAGWYTTNYYKLSYCQTENTVGFVMSPDGEFTLFQLPGTIPPLPENGLPLISDSPDRISIDQAGDITGSYTDAAGVQHGFVRNPYGTITSFDPPEGKQTAATTISDGGAVAGFYHYKASGPPVGFIRVP